MSTRTRVLAAAAALPDPLTDLLLDMADEIDRLSQEVLTLHHRTGDYSKKESA